MRANDPTDPASYHGPDSRSVQRMFAEIAPRYDFLNHFLSASIDKRWRKAAVAKVNELLPSASTLALDVCSGTGDLAIELHRGLKLPVVASDFCHPMLVRAYAKVHSNGLSGSIRNIEADAHQLPYPDARFDSVTNAFGLRNLENPALGLAEFLRVLRPGGVLVILEFSKPAAPLLREAFSFYFNRILPRIGALVSGQSTAYTYLPTSVQKFPSQPALADLISSVGFASVGYRNLTGGIAALHWGVRPVTPVRIP